MSAALHWTAHAIFVWPFKLLWRLATLVETALGILLCLVLGLACMGVGMLLNMTVLGAVFGIPLFVLGFLLVVRGLF